MVWLQLILVFMPVVLGKLNSTSPLMVEAGKMTGLLVQKCLSETVNIQETCNQCLERFGQCLHDESFALLDEVFKEDVIDIANGVQLVRYRGDNDTLTEFPLPREYLSKEASNWELEITQRLYKLFSTHILRLDFGNKILEDTEARHRRRHHMMPIFVFGMMAIGMLVIPMGFQLLAVLGGKALILAKMALLLTSIQGLKKIATSPYNYGLYQTPLHPWYSDRKWLDEGPGLHPDTPDALYDAAQKANGMFSLQTL